MLHTIKLHLKSWEREPGDETMQNGLVFVHHKIITKMLYCMAAYGTDHCPNLCNNGLK